MAERRQDQDLEDQKKQLNSTILEFTSYHQRHYVWIPTHFGYDLVSTLKALTGRFNDLNNVLEGSDSAQYDETIIKEMDEWRSKEFSRDLLDLRNQIQQVLGVEDDL